MQEIVVHLWGSPLNLQKITSKQKRVDSQMMEWTFGTECYLKAKCTPAPQNKNYSTVFRALVRDPEVISSWDLLLLPKSDTCKYQS